MAEFSHPVFGTVGRERPERSERQAARPPEADPQPERQMADSDLVALVECGKITDTIEIDGKKFRMSTMADDVQETLYRRFSGAPQDAATVSELRRMVVAMAVETFNGRPLEALCPDPGQTDPVKAKMAVVRLMQTIVIDKLYGFYDELIKRSRGKVDPEQVKNS
jgi:hypothetical protein